MKYPQRVQEIINTLVAANPELAQGDDDARRKLTLLIAEQTAFELGAQWGTKSGDPGRPQSKDSIAFNDVAAGKLWGWDTINGTTRQPNQFPEGEDITGQHFIAVNPTNYLGAGSIPNPPTSQPPTQPPAVQCAVDLAPLIALAQQNAGDLRELRSRVEVLIAQCDTLRQELAAVNARQDRSFTGKVFGYSFTLDVRK